MTGPPLSVGEARALAALTTLTEASPKVTVRDLADWLGCGVGTAHRHRELLAEKGYVTVTRTGGRKATLVAVTDLSRPPMTVWSCAVCGAERGLDADGAVKHHTRHGRRCPGAGQPPAGGVA